MNGLPEELKEYYVKSERAFYKRISDLKLQFPEIRKQFLATEFTHYPNGGSNDEKAAFILQFTHWIPLLIFFPDNEILEKLKKLKFGNVILRWFIHMDKIENELERLASIEGLYFPLDAWLFAIQHHLIASAHTEMIEAFELGTTHNKLDTNIIHKETEKIFRKRDYKKNQPGNQKLTYQI